MKSLSPVATAAAESWGFQRPDWHFQIGHAISQRDYPHPRIVRIDPCGPFDVSDMLLFVLLLGLPATARALPAHRVTESVVTSSTVVPRFSLDAILEALRTTETGGQVNGGRDATGDGGRAIGPYQIHRPYFLDSGIAGRYEDCRDPEFARRVVIAYWKRWCPDALERCDAQVLARVHNGGPRGARKSSTLPYWRKVELRLISASSPSGRAQRVTGSVVFQSDDPTR